MRSPGRGLAHERGFTLIELMVALALVGLVVTGAYETLRTAMRSWDGVERRAEVLGTQRTAERFVRGQIEQAVSVVERTGVAQRVTFDGRSEEVMIYSDFPAHLGSGLHEVRLTFEHQDGRMRLVARHRPVTLGGEAGQDIVAEQTVVLDGLERGAFEYFGPAAGTGGRGEARWWSEWRDADRLPRLVRIAWALEGADPWPELLVAPRSEGVRIRTRTGSGDERAEVRVPAGAVPGDEEGGGAESGTPGGDLGISLPGSEAQ